MNQSEVIVIGAARSGTKLLRAMIASLTGLPEVPYDVGYVWRHGNERIPHDAFPASLATPATIEYIRSRLPALAGTAHGGFVEKTVGNSLRVDFVRQVYPDAKYVYIIRDGFDVVESAIRSWQARPDVRYLVGKSRSFDLRESPGYAIRYARSIFLRLLGLSQSVKTWGPMYPGIGEDVANLSLPEVCARQWVECMRSMLKSRPQFADDQLLVIRFDDVVDDPDAVSQTLAIFLEVEPGAVSFDGARALVDRSRINRSSLPERESLAGLIQPTMEAWNFDANL